MADAPPSHSASTGVAPSSPWSSPIITAAAASPRFASSLLPGRPVRTSDAVTSTTRLSCSAARTAAVAERVEPVMSPANTSPGRLSAAWMALALFLSRYGGVADAKYTAAGTGVSDERMRFRAASTDMDVASSS